MIFGTEKVETGHCALLWSESINVCRFLPPFVILFKFQGRFVDHTQFLALLEYSFSVEL